MTVQERRAQIDMKVEHCLSYEQDEKERLYQLLYLQGCRIEGIDERILLRIRERCVEVNK